MRVRVRVRVRVRFRVTTTEYYNRVPLTTHLSGGGLGRHAECIVEAHVLDVARLHLAVRLLLSLLRVLLLHLLLCRLDLCHLLRQ